LSKELNRFLRHLSFVIECHSFAFRFVFELDGRA